jgi:ammonia channel protein AmtB
MSSRHRPTCCSSCSAPSWCWRCTPASPSSKWARSAQEPGQCTGEDPGRLLRIDAGLFLRRLRHRLRRALSSPAPRRWCRSGYDLVKFFFLLTFAAAIPAIVSGGIAERARFWPAGGGHLPDRRLRLSLLRRASPGTAFGFQAWLKAQFGAPFHDFAGSVVVHAVGGWIALAAVLLLGARRGRYAQVTAASRRHPPSSSPSSRWAPGY